jgi:hypothetical protein
MIDLVDRWHRLLLCLVLAACSALMPVGAQVGRSLRMKVFGTRGSTAVARYRYPGNCGLPEVRRLAQGKSASRKGRFPPRVSYQGDCGYLAGDSLLGLPSANSHALDCGSRSALIGQTRSMRLQV